MKRYRIIYRLAGKLKVAYVDALNAIEAKARILEQYYHVKIHTVVEIK